MRKGLFKFLAILTCVMFVLPLTACDEKGTDEEEKVLPPNPVSAVTNVTIMYDGNKLTGGVLSVDVSLTSITLTADVQKTGDADGTVTFASSDNLVAEIGIASGVVTLKKKGETVISASAGNKKHEIALVVGDDLDNSVTEKYTVTVIGGISDITAAVEGQQVALSYTFMQDQEFLYWEYKKTDGGELIDEIDLWINGNIFRMPAYDITVTAVINTNLLYTLNVLGASIKTVKLDEINYEFEAGVPDGDIIRYQLPKYTVVTVEAFEDTPDKVFVGWDYEVIKNRVGVLGEREYSFTMPNETLSVWGVFSNTSSLGFATTTLYGVSTKTNGSDVIIDGALSAASDTPLDAAFAGIDGFRFGIAANATAATETNLFPENLSTSKLSTLTTGSQTVKALFKNNHASLPITVDLYASQYTTIARTGEVTIAPGELKTVYFVASAGFHNTMFGFALRANIGGNSGDYVLLDMGVQKADSHPEGDPMFRVIDGKYAQLVSWHPGTPDYPAGSGIRGDCYMPGPTGTNAGQPTGVDFGGRKNVNNNNGITSFTIRDSYMNFNNAVAMGGVPYLTAKYSNLPNFEDSSEVTVYFRVINTNANKGTFKFCLSTSDLATGYNPLIDSDKVSCDFLLDGSDNSVLMFGLTINRTSATDIVYLSIIKEKNDANPNGDPINTSISYDQNIVVQMLYNNKIGVLDTDIYSAEHPQIIV